jgi:glutaredoxin
MTRIPVRLLCVAAALAAACAQAQSTVYRWVDKDGKVQFTDSPPPADAKNVTERRVGGGYVEESQMPYATQMAAKRHPVTLYTSNDCGDLCAQGKALLSQRGVPYAEKNAQTSQADQEALQKVAGSLSVPFLVIGEANVRGFDEGSWNAALDRAGYARTRLPGQAGPRADTATK